MKNVGQINVKCTNQRILFKLKFTERLWQHWQGMGLGSVKLLWFWVIMPPQWAYLWWMPCDGRTISDLWFVIIWEYFRSYRDHMSHVCHRQMWSINRNVQKIFQSSGESRKKINWNIQRICKLDFYLLYFIPQIWTGIYLWSDCRQYH